MAKVLPIMLLVNAALMVCNLPLPKIKFSTGGLFVRGFKDGREITNTLITDAEMREMAHGKAAVERLWEACQVPDYRKLAPAAHAELVGTLYRFLMHRGRIPDNWFAAQVEQADRTDGGIDTLSARIAQIRTWTFVANRPDWLGDPEHWQGISRDVENKLSDALHDRLTERFVDRRTSVLMRRLRENTMLNTEIGKTGEVIVEGHVIGRLDGFTFAPDAAEAGSDAKALQATAQKALAGEIDAGLQGAPLNHIAIDLGFSDLGSPRAMFPDFQFTSLDASRRWLDANPDTAIRFMRAFIRAHRLFYADSAQVAKVACRETGITEQYAERAWAEYTRATIFPRDGTASVAAVQALIEVSGLIRELPRRAAMRAETYIDSAFAQTALASLPPA